MNRLQIGVETRYPGTLVTIVWKHGQKFAGTGTSDIDVCRTSSCDQVTALNCLLNRKEMLIVVGERDSVAHWGPPQ